MPIFRGIDISVVASTEAKALAEYPHPDGSSVRLVAADESYQDPISPRPSDCSILSDGDPTRKKKVNPRISVYIPSMPGEQFWLKYNVLRVPPPATHLFFKMFMNGALITSWGILVDINKLDQPQRPITGTVVRALYEPAGGWHGASVDAEGRIVGIETRYFHFMPGLDKRSIAEDGGLIEVQVFRSKGRRRRAPRMLEFRTQERYGITSPSGGLVDNPQDAVYYDWLLIDSKDAPYASFRFHYRSMKHMLQLNLIPQSDSRNELWRVDSGFSIEHESPPRDSSSLISNLPTAPQFDFGLESPKTTVTCRPDQENPKVDGNTDKRNSDGNSKGDLLEPFPLLMAHERGAEPCKPGADPISREVLNRPLPDTPEPRSRHQSQSSVHSVCPSLTPSLANYVNNGIFGDDDVRIGTAHTVLSSIPSMVELPHRAFEMFDGNSFSDYEHSPPSSTTSPCQALPTPDGYMSTTGSILENNIAQLETSPIVPPSTRRVRSQLQASASENTSFGRINVSSPIARKVSESEWMRRTPSPVEHKSSSRLWSPRLGRKLLGLTAREKQKKSRHSDFGFYSSNESLGHTVVEHSSSTANRTIDVFSHELSDDAATPRIAQFPADCREVSSPSPDASTPSDYIPWDSSSKLPSRQPAVNERPLGNWI